MGPRRASFCRVLYTISGVLVKVLQSSQFSKMLFSTVKVVINASVTQGFHNVCTCTCIRGKALCTFRCSFREIIVVIRQF